jgi:major membrane immunogen (membrane-anchored lipoprotein)
MRRLTLVLVLASLLGACTKSTTKSQSTEPDYAPKRLDDDGAAEGVTTSASRDEANGCVDAYNDSFCEAERSCHHVIEAVNGCGKLVQCEFMTSVDRSWVSAQIQPGSSARLTTRRGAVDTEFELTKRCSFW